jgi:hypothetical protein
LLLDVPHAAVNLPPVGLELSLARSASANAAAKLRHFDAAARQPWKQIFKLGQFDLQLAFTGTGVTGKDIENQLRAIDDAGVDDALNITLLGRREVVIEQNHIGGNRGRRAGNFLELALADQGGGVGPVFALGELADDLGARAGRERTEFVERVFGCKVGSKIGAEVRGIHGRGR